jgi:hypothetical protein
MVMNNDSLCVCGNYKNRYAKTCMDCYLLLQRVYAGEPRVQDKRDAFDETEDFVDTTRDRCECGNMKMKVSKMCWECWRTKRKKEARTPREHPHGTVDRPATKYKSSDYVCGCGDKKDPRAEVCWRCHYKRIGRMKRCTK